MYKKVSISYNKVRKFREGSIGEIILLKNGIKKSSSIQRATSLKAFSKKRKSRQAIEWENLFNNNLLKIPA